MVDRISGFSSGLSLSRASLRASIKIEELPPHDDEAFQALYRLYEVCFPIADEREPPEAFAQAYALNQDLAAQTNYGPYREVTALIRLWDGGPVIGGHIFGVVTSPQHLEAGFPSSVQGIYTFLHPDFRGLIAPRMLINYSKTFASKVFPPPAHIISDPVIFFEVNNPLKMTEAEIRQDTESSGTDPFRRYNFWLRCGFKPLDFEYIQPRLRPDAEAVRCLDLFGSAEMGKNVSGVLLKSHLEKFIAISVLKNKDPYVDEDFFRMNSKISDSDAVNFKNDKICNKK